MADLRDGFFIQGGAKDRAALAMPAAYRAGSMRSAWAWKSLYFIAPHAAPS